MNNQAVSSFENVNQSESVAIVGAGICGLCTALALNQKGFRVSLFEGMFLHPLETQTKRFSNGLAEARLSSGIRTPFWGLCAVC